MLPDEHIVYDELKRERRNKWQPEALRLPLYVPEPEDDARSEESDEETTDRGVIVIDMNDGYSIAE